MCCVVRSNAIWGGAILWCVLMGWLCCQVNGIRTPQANFRGVHFETKSRASATFAMGSFWRAEAVFGCLPGVLRTRVGYCGGTKINPDYHNVGDHAECCEVEYDPTKLHQEELLNIFWSNHDPSQIFGQGPDVGDQYRSMIFFLDEDDFDVVRRSRERIQLKLGDELAVSTQIQRSPVFYPAETEHQKFELRRKSSLMQIVGDFTDEEVVTSTIATKLNSYAAGFCSPSIKRVIDSKVGPALKSKPELLRFLVSEFGG